MDIITGAQMIEFLCRYGQTEVIKLIARTPTAISGRCAISFLTSSYYIEIAKRTRFIRTEDGKFEKV